MLQWRLDSSSGPLALLLGNQTIYSTSNSRKSASWLPFGAHSPAGQEASGQCFVSSGEPHTHVFLGCLLSPFSKNLAAGNVAWRQSSCLAGMKPCTQHHKNSSGSGHGHTDSRISSTRSILPQLSLSFSKKKKVQNKENTPKTYMKDSNSSPPLIMDFVKQKHIFFFLQR